MGRGFAEKNLRDMAHEEFGGDRADKVDQLIEQQHATRDLLERQLEIAERNAAAAEETAKGVNRPDRTPIFLHDGLTR